MSLASPHLGYDDDEHRDNEQAIAGPSDWWRRLWTGGQSRRRISFSAENDGGIDAVVSVADADESGAGEQKSSLKWTRKDLPARHAALVDKKGKRQASSTTSSLSSMTSYSTAPLFVAPPSTSSSSSTSSLFATGSLNASATSFDSSSSSSSSPSRTRTSTTDFTTFTSLWSTSRSATSASASPTYVSGVTFNLTLGGTRDDEAVYAVAVEVGHGATASDAQQNNYAWVSDESEEEGARENRRLRRQVADTGVGYQRVNLQVDLGSSDMWVAVTNCSTSDCTSAPTRFDPSASISSGVRANMTYHSGGVSGTILWDEVQLDKFAIAYQAFIGGDRVTNENLGGGNFSGVLGMALPANSIISSQIPGTTSSNPDGATFLDNLFGSGTFAPSQRIFSLALERREDVRTTSILTIGSTFNRYCPSPCSPSYISIIANPNLGVIGYLHWRIPLLGVTATDWSDAQHGSGPSQKTITLGGSLVVTSRTTPLAVLDSGGVAVLVGHKPYADAIYAAYGISASADGYYRMPCKTQLAFSFNFGGQWFAAHPLDMSWPDPTDPSQSICIGAIQYASLSNDVGDFVFGSSFLKNVYSVFSYPDQARNSGVWQPGVGLISLTNASVASQDFYAVRTLRQSLAQVSSQGPFIGGGSSTTSPSSSATSGSGGGSVVNTTAIVAGSVVGFFVIAAVAFCAWFFFLKRKYGATGYPLVQKRGRQDGRDTPSSEPTSTSTRRTKKHQEALRQKSMIEGYSDYEGDSWTEATDSVRLGYMPEVPEEEGMEAMRGKRVGSVGSSLAAGAMGPGYDEKSGMTGGRRGSDLSAFGTNEKEGPFDSPSSTHDDGDLVSALPVMPASRARSGSRPKPPNLDTDQSQSDLSGFTYPPSNTTANASSQASFGSPIIPYAQPPAGSANPRSGSSSRHRDPARGASMSLSMSGPFPGRRQSDMDISPMYEIRTADYFEVEPRGRRGSAVRSGGGSGRAEGSGSGSRERE